MAKKKKSENPVKAKVKAKRLYRAADRLNDLAANIAADCSLAADYKDGDREKWLAEARREWVELTAAVRKVEGLLFPPLPYGQADQADPAEANQRGTWSTWTLHPTTDPSAEAKDTWASVAPSFAPSFEKRAEMDRKLDAILAALPVLANGLDRLLDGETPGSRVAQAVNAALAARIDDSAG